MKARLTADGTVTQRLPDGAEAQIDELAAFDGGETLTTDQERERQAFSARAPQTNVAAGLGLDQLEARHAALEAELAALESGDVWSGVESDRRTVTEMTDGRRFHDMAAKSESAAAGEQGRGAVSASPEEARRPYAADGRFPLALPHRLHRHQPKSAPHRRSHSDDCRPLKAVAGRT